MEIPRMGQRVARCRVRAKDWTRPGGNGEIPPRTELLCGKSFLLSPEGLHWIHAQTKVNSECYQAINIDGKRGHSGKTAALTR